jgi:hypothetical protein
MVRRSPIDPMLLPRGLARLALPIWEDYAPEDSRPASALAQPISEYDGDILNMQRFRARQAALEAAERAAVWPLGTVREPIVPPRVRWAALASAWSLRRWRGPALLSHLPFTTWATVQGVLRAVVESGVPWADVVRVFEDAERTQT